jgi:hypothetical protein
LVCQEPSRPPNDIKGFKKLDIVKNGKEIQDDPVSLPDYELVITYY